MRALYSRYLLIIMIILLMYVFCGQIFAADENERESAVTLTQLPAAVHKTLLRESAGGTIGKIEKEIEHGKVVYEAIVVLDNREYEVEIAENGILIKKELEDQDEDQDTDEHECVCTKPCIWSFEQDKPGTTPKGWYIAETSSTGTAAVWHIITDKSAPSPAHAVAITANRNHGRTYNLLMAKKTSYKDLEIELMVKAVAGKEDQGGGPVWRAKDADNYYICRWNPLEDNFRLYFVKDGIRRQLASANVKANPGIWHKIKIEHKGTRIEAEFDGKKLIEFNDSTFTDAGMIGLWVKADGRSKFDNIKVNRIRSCTKCKSDD